MVDDNQTDTLTNDSDDDDDDICIIEDEKPEPDKLLSVTQPKLPEQLPLNVRTTRDGVSFLVARDKRRYAIDIMKPLPNY